MLFSLQPRFAIYRPRHFDDFLDHPENTLYSIVVVDPNLNIIEEAYVPKNVAEAICDGPVYFLDFGPTPPFNELMIQPVDEFSIRTRFIGTESNIPKILNFLS